MDLDAIGRFISTVGFPIAVAVYLLWRLDPILRKLAETQAVQVEILRRIQEVLDGAERFTKRGYDPHRRE